MLTRWRFGTPTQLSLLFVLIAATTLTSLAWLWRSALAEDDRVEQARREQLLGQAGVLFAHEISRMLDLWSAAARSALDDRTGTVPPGTSLVVFTNGGVTRVSGVPLVFVPAVPLLDVGDGALDDAARQEFQRHDLSRAEALYRQVAGSADRPGRAMGLVGLARTLRARGKLTEALAAYSALSALGGTPVGGFPARVIAGQERASILASLGDTAGSQGELARVTSALLAGEFLVDRATFDIFAPRAGNDSAESARIDFAEAVVDLWPSLQTRPEGRAAVSTGRAGVIAVWGTARQTSAAVVGPVAAAADSARPVLASLNVEASIADGGGHVIWGAARNDAPESERAMHDLGLPWKVRLRAAGGTGGDAATTSTLSRRRLLTAGFGLVAVVIAIATYAVFRSLRRELHVARLQSDFVAAVSHEFRSPLTAMRHVTDVLEEGRASPDQQARYYRVIGHETRRLQGLVEHLLDFGRVETGGHEYQFEDINPAELARQVTDDLRPVAATSQHEIVIDAPDDDLRVRADREALALALRNLVDNAIKYSPPGTAVTVMVRPHGAQIGLAVIDRGSGIPVSEQRRVFGQFVRGSAARAGQIKGTGIGLTMADRIVRAHDGRLTLQSVEGQGSTFTILLPAAGGGFPS